MSSKIKVDNISDQGDNNLINKCGSTITLGANGNTIELASGASQTGFGRTGTVDWDTTPKTATFSAVSGDGFFCNTTGGAFTCNLPAGSAGAIVSLADYAGTWQTNNLTVSPNGSDKIGSVNSDVVLDTEGQSVTFVFVDSTQGWINIQDSTSNVRGNEFILATGGTITCCGNYKIHTFTGPGTFTVCKIANCAANNKVDYLVVAGGGGGTAGSPNTAKGHAGGGAGGVRFYLNTTCAPMACAPASPRNNYPSGTEVTVTATSFPITVGGGGTKGSPTYPTVTSGANSTFSTITSNGGGGGTGAAGNPGGSGSGGAAEAAPNNAKGNGNVPPTSPPQGQPGGDGANCGGNPRAGGGGGGATAAGGTGGNSNAGVGGAGATTNINGTPTAFAGGGGGAGNVPSNNSRGAGGVGGGGTNPGGLSGVANTGGGGAAFGRPSGTGGSGGSGIVIIRYKFQ